MELVSTEATNLVPMSDVPAVEPVTLEATPEEPAPEPDPITGAVDQFIFEDGFAFVIQEFGDVQTEAPSGSTLIGTSAGDIFQFFDGQTGVSVLAGPGDDIIMAWGGSGTLNAGSGGDIVDVADWRGRIALGSGGYDALNFTASPASGLTVVTGFVVGEDNLYLYGELLEGDDTASGYQYSLDGRAVLLLSGIHEDAVA